ncbi:uncharacterized protein J8A68_005833 [[Candida] subhashii]|uniref:Large ribosomal subunit protein mL50 n=1 Tax=[Candida] subhashii TaxID=561895 RepID=A0A8J5QGD7_9ASCO|nr:uncharacterized protein J8A68_005833 [[Candida] subhashii]KAG7660716.1 hypothetical protein J8A68_005833 [[Candida] subhashii]
MFTSVIKQRTLVSTKVPIRSFSNTTYTSSWLGDLFGKNKPVTKQKKQEIIEKQDEFIEEEKEGERITILGYENSKDIVKPGQRLKGLKIVPWKSRQISTQQVPFKSDTLYKIFKQVYKENFSKEITEADFPNITFHDFNKRLRFANALRVKLGFEVSDYVISKGHTLEDFHSECQKFLESKRGSERNPKGIRLVSMSPMNIYLNNERAKSVQERKFEKLAEQARENQRIQLEKQLAGPGEEEQSVASN